MASDEMVVEDALQADVRLCTRASMPPAFRSAFSDAPPDSSSCSEDRTPVKNDDDAAVRVQALLRDAMQARRDGNTQRYDACCAHVARLIASSTDPARPEQVRALFGMDDAQSVAYDGGARLDDARAERLQRAYRWLDRDYVAREAVCRRVPLDAEPV